MRRSIALVGDTHADQSNRFDEHNRIMSWIVEDARARGCTHALHSGDVWEKTSTVAAERLSVADYVRAFAEHMAFLAVGGNHDNMGDIEWIGRLRGRHPIVSMTRPDVVELDGISVACLPWPRKATLLAALGITNREEGDRVAVQALKDVLRGLGQRLESRPGPHLFLGHCQLRGSRISISQPPLTGCDFELGLEDIGLVRAAFYALGHIHLGEGNEWDVDGAPAAFPGSPRRNNYGEIEKKGYIVITFEGDKLVGWERVATPCTPMVHLSALWSGERLETEAIPDIAGAEVRLRYTTPSDQREAAAAGAAALLDNLMAAGALLVKVEPLVITEQRARAPELTTALTLADKIEALWKVQNFEPGERREALLNKLRDLQETDHAA